MNKPVTSSFMAMKGAGYYSKATVGAKHVMDNAAQMVIDAVGRMQLKDDGSIFRATDMGCADGVARPPACGVGCSAKCSTRCLLVRLR